MIHAATDEVLEHLSYAVEENRHVQSRDDLGASIDDTSFRSAVYELVADDSIDSNLQLSTTGTKRAKQIVRRHRLAEVLFVEAMGTGLQDAEQSACEMEHMLSDAVVDRVCTFLGHPPVCPHGKRIPSGDCCRVYSKQIEPLVMRVIDLPVGASAKIAFIAPKTLARLEKLAAFGIVPGSEIRLVARKPTCVIACGATSIALEDEIGREVYVR
ncbi:MAG: metal-dependent transcriptional regulator [Thermoanaerobaculia bacterium]